MSKNDLNEDKKRDLSPIIFMTVCRVYLGGI